MERKISLIDTISIITFYDISSLDKMANLILQKNNDYFFIQEEYEKLVDITQMPDYIKNDWIKYNKKDLNLLTINKHIEYLKKSDTLQSIEQFEKNERLLESLISIRRDFIIKGILWKKELLKKQIRLLITHR